MYRFFAIFSIFLLLFFTSCREERMGYVQLVFEHHWNGEPIRFDDTQQYINKAGNIVTFTNLEYMISHLIFRGNSTIRFSPSILYVGAGRPTMDHVGNDGILRVKLGERFELPIGTYERVEFTFGLPNPDNLSHIFPNPPKRGMFWPEHMGGGYHFMKLDGRWREFEGDTARGFALHLGRLARNNTILSNGYFPVSLSRNFQVNADRTTVITIYMDVEQWTQSHYIWDHSVMPSGIMNREHAMDSLARNGKTAFR